MGVKMRYDNFIKNFSWWGIRIIKRRYSMKKLQFLALSMLFSTGMMIQAYTQGAAKAALQGQISDSQRAQLAQAKETIASNLSEEQALKLEKLRNLTDQQKINLRQAVNNMTPEQKMSAAKAIASKVKSGMTEGQQANAASLRSAASTQIAAMDPTKKSVAQAQFISNLTPEQQAALSKRSASTADSESTGEAVVQGNSYPA